MKSEDAIRELILQNTWTYAIEIYKYKLYKLSKESNICQSVFLNTGKSMKFFWFPFLSLSPSSMLQFNLRYQI